MKRIARAVNGGILGRNGFEMITKIGLVTLLLTPLISARAQAGNSDQEPKVRDLCKVFGVPKDPRGKIRLLEPDSSAASLPRSSALRARVIEAGVVEEPLSITHHAFADNPVALALQWIWAKRYIDASDLLSASIERLAFRLPVAIDGQAYVPAYPYLLLAFAHMKTHDLFGAKNALKVAKAVMAHNKQMNVARWIYVAGKHRLDVEKEPPEGLVTQRTTARWFDLQRDEILYAFLNWRLAEREKNGDTQFREEWEMAWYKYEEERKKQPATEMYLLTSEQFHSMAYDLPVNGVREHAHELAKELRGLQQLLRK